MLMKTVFLLALASAAYADGVRQQSGPMGRSGGGSHSPSQGSHSRNVMVIDGQYSALPVAAVESRWFPVAPDPVVLDSGDVECSLRVQSGVSAGSDHPAILLKYPSGCRNELTRCLML